MTQEEFNDTEFRKDMKAYHINYGEGTIIGADFDEKLINLSLPGITGDNWCRCENVDIRKEE